jgi:diphosphomevalonate decarboxylase
LTPFPNYGILLMMTLKAKALAHPNIAFIKYWGMEDEARRIPANDSISMNLGCLSTRTNVTYDTQLKEDTLTLNGDPVTGEGLLRVQRFLDCIRALVGKKLFAHVESENNFPIGAGLASSASGFAALTLAGTAALGLDLSERELSSLARFGSGSACRSIPGGFVEWRTDPLTGESYAESIAPADHWDLADCIAILSDAHKPVGSEAGMRLADTSPLQEARVLDSERRLDLCREAIINRDFEALAEVTELDSNMMHAVMMTSQPPLFYWLPESLALMEAVKDWQGEGLSVTTTLDAGPNVHVICTQDAEEGVLERLREFPGVMDVLRGTPAGPARLVPLDSQE